MRILHTADWHLGRVFYQESLLDDQAHLLEQLMRGLKESHADVLIIAGDIFDRPNPKREAVALFDDFLTQVYRDTKTAIVAIAGNHDAPERVAFGRGLQDTKRVLIRGPLEAVSTPLVLEDKHGKVAFSALPFGEVYAGRSIFNDLSIAEPADVLAAQMWSAKASVPTNCRWVVTAHAFVAGSATTESERPLGPVGGVETVSPLVFDGAHYVALGHLHRSQQAGRKQIRYSGSWMAFDFDEVSQDKSFTLVELDGAGETSVEQLPFMPKRQVRVIEGLLQDLIAAGQAKPTTDFVKARLSDEGALVDPMSRLRAIYPNIMQLERTRRPSLTTVGGIKICRDLHEPQKLLAAFSQEVRGSDLSVAENEQIQLLLARLQTEDC
jgi:exonuclease SbcD